MIFLSMRFIFSAMFLMSTMLSYDFDVWTHAG